MSRELSVGSEIVGHAELRAHLGTGCAPYRL
jgi:hypothetical protein